MIVVHTEIIIGNFMIEVIEKGLQQFTLETLRKFDKILSLRVAKLDYHYKPLLFHIEEFADTYRDFIKLETDTVIIRDNVVKDLVIRYFRIGCPTNLVNEIKAVAKEVLKQ